jgi:hypothetical protein
MASIEKTRRQVSESAGQRISEMEAAGTEELMGLNFWLCWRSY